MVSAIPEVTCVQLTLFMGLTFPDMQRIAGTGKYCCRSPQKRLSSPYLARGFDSL